MYYGWYKRNRNYIARVRNAQAKLGPEEPMMTVLGIGTMYTVWMDGKNPERAVAVMIPNGSINAPVWSKRYNAMSEAIMEVAALACAEVDYEVRANDEDVTMYMDESGAAVSYIVRRVYDGFVDNINK